MDPKTATPRAAKLATATLIALSFLAGAETSAQVTNNWVNWTAPASYSSTAVTTPVSGWWGTDYNYAPSLTGSLTLPDSSIVGVTLSGEVVGEGASVFTSGGPGTWAYWGGSPSAFVSANVPSLPPTDTRIALAGWGTATQTLTFSAPVSNLVLIIGSLGSPGTPATWTFNQSVDVLSGNLVLSQDSRQITGQEANGVVQFIGRFNTFSWSVSAPEMYAAWNLGVTSADAPSAVPEPSTWLATSLLAAGAAFVRLRRRRRAKAA